MNIIRQEADEAHRKWEEAAARVKALEQENLTKEQDIVSLNHRNALLETEVDKLEKTLAEAKLAAMSGEAHSSEVEALHRKVQLLEDEAEEADKNLRETNEKHVPFFSITNLQHDTGAVSPAFTVANLLLLYI